MNSLSHGLTNDLQWQAYQQLELIPDSIVNPSTTNPKFVFGLNSAWRTLISLLIDELVAEQRVEYLERCWQSSQFEDTDKPTSACLQKLWVLMN